MDRFVDLLLWALAGAAIFAVVGALFGALAGAHARVRGQAPGSSLGNAVARALIRGGDEDRFKAATGALSGAVDGAVFLAVVGFVVGAVLGHEEAVFGWEAFMAPLRAILLLAIASVLLGALAWVLIWGGQRAVGVLFGLLAGAVVGWVLDARWAIGGVWYGVLGGLGLGLLAAVFPGTSKDRGEESAPPTGPRRDEEFTE
jgi:hypothetical protein